MTEKEKQQLWKLDGAITALEEILKHTYADNYLRQAAVTHLATYKQQHSRLIQAQQTKRRGKMG